MKSRFCLDLLIIFKWMQDLKKVQTRTIENEKPRSHLVLLRCLNFKKNLQNLEKIYLCFSTSTLKQKLIDKSLGLLLWKVDGFPIHHILAQQTQLRNWREWLSSSNGKVLCIYILLSTVIAREANQFMHEHPINLSVNCQFVYTQIPSMHMNAQLAHTWVLSWA